MAGPEDPRVTEQTLRKGEVEIRKLEVEARGAEAAAMVPNLPSEIPAGKLDAGDKSSPIGTVAAYRSLDAIAMHIAKLVPEDANKVRIAEGDPITRERAVHSAVVSVLDRLEAELAAAEGLLAPADARPILPVGPLAALTLATSALQLFGSLMRTNTTVRSQDVTIGFHSVAATVGRELLTMPGRSVLIDGAAAPAASTMSDRTRALENRRDELVRTLAKYRVENVDEPSAEFAVAAERLAALKEFSSEQVKTKELDQMKAVFDEVEKAARAAADERAKFAQYAGRAAMVDKILNDATAVITALLTADASGASVVDIADAYNTNKDAFLLILESAYAGGESVYEEKVGKDRGLHTGSAVVSYMLLDPESTLLEAGNVSAHCSATNKLARTTIVWGHTTLPFASAET